MTKSNTLQAAILILNSTLLLLFWVFFAVFLPMDEPYLNWVNNPNWTWINMLGFIGSFLGIFTILILNDYLNNKTLNIASFLSILGICMMSGILYFEAFILKGVAIEAPEIVIINESFYRHLPFKWANLIGGCSFSFGTMLLSTRILKNNLFKKWKAVLFLLAVPLFSIVIMPPNIRILGILLYSISVFSMSFELKNIEKQKSLS